MSSVTNLFLVRHGQTEWNKEHRLQGHKNSPLTQKGKEQALNTKHALQGYEIHKAYVSPLQRAQDTLELIIDQRDIDVVISNNLKEINLGPWEGKTKPETLLSDPQQYHYFWQEQDKFNLAGAETYQQLQDRVVSELQAIFSKEKGKNILIVSHWIAIKAAVAYYKSTPLSDLSSLPDPKNGEYTILSELNTQIKKSG
ncbi:histidine phosphatase family protein [Marinomonas sp. 2405UD66-6]|uniref:histidine phosphatase family protein n=1 Tax=Marinomonas sp. 2405UD66-6 TaxID=3391834 RepID=UPI0039C9E6AD